VQVCGQRQCIQPFNKPVESGSQSAVLPERKQSRSPVSMTEATVSPPHCCVDRESASNQYNKPLDMGWVHVCVCVGGGGCVEVRRCWQGGSWIDGLT
jgi:hypothetical protein